MSKRNLIGRTVSTARPLVLTLLIIECATTGKPRKEETVNARLKNAARCLLTWVVVLALCGCATTKRDWQEASRQGTVEAYEQFLRDHPDAEQSSQARRRIAELLAEEDWGRAKSMDTIVGYRDYLTKHPQSKKAKEAQERREELESQRDWEQTKSSGTIASYAEFIQKHPASQQVSEARQELRRLEAERDWKSAERMNSARAFADFLRRHPSSQYSAEAKKRLEALQAEEAWTDAMSKNSEEGWLDFIEKYWNTPKAEAAIVRLKNHEVIRSGGIITWATLGGKTVSSEGLTYYLNDNSGMSSQRWSKLGPIVWVGELQGSSAGLRVVTGMALIPRSK